ncbi:hypothetical protein Hbl1158_10275 [Halobaculum sp. CBA1158]|uniref:hypothetical protein n=1 Tax=Halobaculum sp. CBA1158 TaxID=2904243 RepID=UPI001F3FF12E|nr:hypothetical protein [Halobaculum sp. CBA1158]UIO98920.1 hypothetical protein Hbl1158_10275 [Halobaculum sp. CBA1158]
MVGTQSQPTPAAESEGVTISRRPPEKYRWRCPGGHVVWDRTNNHIWCPACRREAEQGRDIDPEHYHIVDDVTGREIAWEDIIVEDDA